MSLTSLNPKQHEAVVSEHRRLLVLAGAGSGKTKTLLQKIIYLIEEKRVKPSEILAITFTRNAANEMIDRLIMSADESGEYQQIISSKSLRNDEKEHYRRTWKRNYKWIDGLTIKTFHSFCYSTLRTHGVNEYDNKFRVIGDHKLDEQDELQKNVAPETVFEVIHKLLIKECESNDYLLKLKRYILDYFVDKIHIENKEHFILYEKPYTTLDGTKVASKSEQFIADWLFRHSIRYVYEPKINISDFTFQPDFFIPDANLYIEHLSNLSYPTADKEQQFAKGNITCAFTYEWMARDSALFNHSLENIVRNKLPENYHRDVNLTFEEEFKGYHEHVKEFVRMIIRIGDMIKTENTSADDILAKAMQDPHNRIRTFYELAIPIFKAYLYYARDCSYLDFNDLISTTASLFKNHADIAELYRNRYKYILVDEFQDVNNLQVELIKHLLKPETQLFCVGDDWQSIYGFRGSNVDYIVEFEKYFENAKVLKLDKNYRSTQNIVGASNEVIRKNKFMVDKEISALKMSEHKIVVFSGKSLNDNIDYCLDKVEELRRDGLQHDDILFLYRRSKMAAPYYDAFKSAGVKFNGKTIHASKGLEAKAVFVLGLVEGQGGFPDIWLEDRIFQVIKKANHDLLLEEERRLFYVAMTRAKDKLFLISEKGSESSFLDEIPPAYAVRTAEPLRSIVEEVPVCDTCSRAIERIWSFCPYCASAIKS